MFKPALLALILVLFGGVGAKADFTGYYSFPQNNGPNSFYYQALQNGAHTYVANGWSINSNEQHTIFGGLGYPSVYATDSRLIVDSGTPHVTPGVLCSGILEVSILAPSGGLFSFDYFLQLSTATMDSYRDGYYFVNGNKFALTEGSGTVSNVRLNAGDIFGFGVDMGAFISRTQVDANLSITNFSAPVPEPQSFVLLLLGAGLFVLWALSAHLMCNGRRNSLATACRSPERIMFSLFQ